jgi:hypothetical protein
MRRKISRSLSPERAAAVSAVSITDGAPHDPQSPTKLRRLLIVIDSSISKMISVFCFILKNPFRVERSRAGRVVFFRDLSEHSAFDLRLCSAGFHLKKNLALFIF